MLVMSRLLVVKSTYQFKNKLTNTIVEYGVPQGSVLVHLLFFLLMLPLGVFKGLQRHNSKTKNDLRKLKSKIF